MTLQAIFSNTLKQVKSNSPEILTALSVSGVLTTSYLVGKASYKASEIINDNERQEGVIQDRKERIKHRVKHTWRLYVPAGISGALTIGCIIGSSKANSRRTAAAVTAYSISERAFAEYREKVVEQLGNNKEQKIRDDLAQERVSNKPPSGEIVVVGDGHVLCCELYTQRYFRSTMEALRKAGNDINAKILQDVYVPLDEFYDLVGLEYTSMSNRMGWDSDKLMELRFTAVFGPGSEPCLAFDYNYVKPLR